VVGRYLAFQVPGWVLAALLSGLAHAWWKVPTWAALAAVALWVLKDAVLFPFVWRAYGPGPTHDARVPPGARARAREDLQPTGYVEVAGELWRAELLPGEPLVRAGESVRVVGREGFTLRVSRAPADGQVPPSEPAPPADTRP